MAVRCASIIGSVYFEIVVETFILNSKSYKFYCTRRTSRKPRGKSHGRIMVNLHTGCCENLMPPRRDVRIGKLALIFTPAQRFAPRSVGCGAGQIRNVPCGAARTAEFDLRLYVEAPYQPCALLVSVQTRTAIPKGALRGSRSRVATG
jgi:hypothetical protein